MDLGTILIVVSAVFAVVMFGLRETQQNSANLTLYYLFNVLMYVGVIAAVFSVIGVALGAFN